jgi:hypothetical protein
MRVGTGTMGKRCNGAACGNLMMEAQRVRPETAAAGRFSRERRQRIPRQSAMDSPGQVQLLLAAGPWCRASGPGLRWAGEPGPWLGGSPALGCGAMAERDRTPLAKRGALSRPDPGAPAQVQLLLAAGPWCRASGPGLRWAGEPGPCLGQPSPGLRAAGDPAARPPGTQSRTAPGRVLGAAERQSTVVGGLDRSDGRRAQRSCCGNSMEAQRCV